MKFRNSAFPPVMTADQRLDQMEPLLAEAMTILDRHTAQLKQLTNAVGQLTTIAIRQSDNISFLLTENVHIKDRLTKIEGDVAEMKGDVAQMKGDVAELKHGQAGINSKLDLILSKLN